MPDKITASYINKQMERVKNRFGSHIGEKAYIRQQYSEILRPVGLKSGGKGKVMSYSEAYKRMREATNSEIQIDFTKEKYKEIVNKFYEEQKEHFYIKSEMKIQRERLENIVYDSFEYMGAEPPDLSEYSFDDLLDAVREANDMYSTKKRDTTDSPKFYERVVKYLVGNGDAETE